MITRVITTCIYMSKLPYIYCLTVTWCCKFKMQQVFPNISNWYICIAFPLITITDTSQIAGFMGPTWGPLGPVGPRWAPCRPNESCYQGYHVRSICVYGTANWVLISLGIELSPVSQKVSIWIDDNRDFGEAFDSCTNHCLKGPIIYPFSVKGM